MYEYNVKLIRVLDGDTCQFEVSLGFNILKIETLRLYGINTPEIHSTHPDEKTRGVAARDYAVQALSSPNVEIKVKTEKPYPLDKYGRWLGVVFYRAINEAPGVWHNLNEEMITKGYAKAYFGVGEKL